MGMKMLKILVSPDADLLLRAHGKKAADAVTKYLKGVPAGQRDDALAALSVIVKAYRRALKTPDVPMN